MKRYRAELVWPGIIFSSIYTAEYPAKSWAEAYQKARAAASSWDVGVKVLCVRRIS